MAEDLFDSDSLDSKMDFLNDKKASNSDGLWRVDATKASDPKKGYLAKIRLLPNLKRDGTLGQSAIEKITHWVDIRNVKELSGMYDSPKNFGDKCALSDLYYTLKDSKNAILQERAKCLKYSKKYYSYILVIEDEVKENIGKILIFQYGKQIKDKILQERNGEISDKCKVFDMAVGKNLKMIVKTKTTAEGTFPDYNSCAFEPTISSLPIYNEEKQAFKNVPVVGGKIDPKYHKTIKDFLLNREHELEEFEPKRLTNEQQGKVTEIINYLSGKTSRPAPQEEASDDLDMEEEGIISSAETTNDEEDSFFNDFD